MNKSVDQYNTIYHHSIGKKSIDADYSDLTEEVKKIVSLKLMIELELLSTRIFLVKVTLKKSLDKFLLFFSVRILGRIN